MDSELRTEAIQFSRYLVDAEPSEELIERYRRANDILFADHPSSSDLAVLAFARLHPWSIPMLDASTAVTRAGSLLRKKLLVMMAILETTPDFVDRTEPRSVGLARLALRLGSAAVAAAASLVMGLALSTALTIRHRVE